MNQAFLPREVIKWLDSLDLTYQIRNIKRDLANGFIIAEIISRYYPSLFDINKFNTSNGLREKKVNWEFIAKLLQKKEILEKHGEFKLDKREYEPIMAIAPDSGFNFLLRLYEFLTRKKLLNQQKMTMTDKRIQEVIIPSYAQQTASTLARDRELVRIVNANEKQFRTQNAISSHIEKQRHERANQNLVEYILMKRRKQMEEELRKQALELSKKQKENVELHAPEIKEIPVKSFNTQNNKKKELEGLAEGREIVEQLSKIALPLMEQDPIKKELSELKDVDKISKVELILMNATEFSEKSLQLIIMAMKENVSYLLINFIKINVIVEYLHNNYADFKRFFKIMLACIRTINFGIQPFALLIDFIKQVGTELTLLDPSSCQLLFESIALEEIVDIIKMYQNKRNQLITVLYAFGHQDSLSRLRLVRKIKDHLGKDLNSFFSILAYLVNLSCEAEMDDDFYNLFLFYSIMAIEFASPIARTNGLKILTEICRISYFQILNLLSKFEKLLDDDWWEVKAQILIICARLLLILWQENPNEMLNQQQQEDYDDYEQQQQQQQNQIEKFQQQEEIKEESQLQNTEDDIKLNEQQQQAQQNSMSQTLDEQLGQLNMENNEERLEKLKQQKEKNQQILIDFIYHIFESNQSENILRIGLIYLAPVINYYPEICDRYLEIILLIQEDIREQILIINPLQGMEEGQIVRGCNTFVYELTGAPLSWNSAGISQSLNKYVEENQLQNFEKEHLEILVGCLVNQLQETDSENWFKIYESLKIHIFLAFADRELCAYTSEILRKIFTFNAIQSQVMKVQSILFQLNSIQNSETIFLKILSLVYHPDRDELCQTNLLDFFEFLTEQGQIFKDYIYKIIKEFSEKHKNAFLGSNLVKIMNNLSKERRGMLFGGD